MQAVLVPVLIATLLLEVGLLLFANSRSDWNRTVYFTVMCNAVLFYTVGYLVEVLARTAEGATAALCVENFGIPFIGPFLLLTTIGLFYPSLSRKWHLGVALAYSLGMFVIILFNDHHHLYYASAEMTYDGVSHFVRLGRGFLYFVNHAIVLLCMLTAYAIMGLKFARGSKKLRRQMLFLIIGSSIGFITHILNIVGLLPAGLDPTPVAMAIGLSFFSVSLFHDGLIDVVYKARNTAVETLDDAFVVLDSDGDYLYCNHRAQELFPKLATFLGTEPIRTLPGWPLELRGLKEDKVITFYMPGKDSEELQFRASARKIQSQGGKPLGWSILMRDITEESCLLKQLQEMATTDSLTGIFNRRQLFAMAERELEIAKRHDMTCALIMFDIDWFKQINDTHGHSVGDKVLRRTARAIEDELRVYDIFGRIGGEEFIIFAQGANLRGMQTFAERLRKTVEGLVVMEGGMEIRFTACFGVAEIPVGMNMDDAVHLADMAMYRAKARGRNQVVSIEADAWAHF